MARHQIHADSNTLMRQLARMAGIPEGGFQRMVLVLDLDAFPKLYTEGLLRPDADDPQAQSLEQSGVKLQAEERHVEVEAVDPAIHVKVSDTAQRLETGRITGVPCWRSWVPASDWLPGYPPREVTRPPAELSPDEPDRPNGREGD